MTDIATQIIQNIGGLNNIKSVENCMTRVRISLHNNSLASIVNLKKINIVIGVVEVAGQLQIIVGPGKPADIVSNINKQLNSINITNTINSANSVKQQVKQRYQVSFSGALKQLADIFVPLIPALIASGFLLGISNLLKNSTLFPSLYTNYTNYVNLISTFGSSFFAVLPIAVGFTSARVFGGSVAIGVTMAAILTAPALSNISILGQQLVPARGGIISVILVVYFACLVEKKLKQYISGALDLILIPLLTVLLSGIVAIVIIQPIGGIIANAIATASMYGLQNGGAFAGFILAGTFLPIVMTGLHQALIPIHFQLIQEIGYTPLFPILAMAGAGQVGASFAVLLKTKNTRLKKIIKTALPVGILGVGEPLIYGVTLPLGKPFITACLGGAMGGAVIAFFKVGAVSLGISGLPLLLAVNNGFIMYYLYGIITAYLFGFLFTYFIKIDDTQI